MRKTLCLLPLASALLLSGCISLAPDFERPQAPVEQVWPRDEATKNAALLTEGLQKWSDFFTDERLNRLIALGLKNNRSLRSAFYSVEQARAQYNVSRADLLPSVAVQAQESAGRTPASTSSAGRDVTTHTYSANAAMASYELDLFGRVRNLNEQALQSYFQTQAAQRTAQMTVITEIAQTWLGLGASKDQLKLAQDTYASQYESLKLIRRSYDLGASSMLEVQQALQTVATARASMAQAQRSVAQYRNALATLVGTAVPPELEPEGLASDVTRSQVSVASDIPSEVLLARPDIAAAEAALRAANANIGVARAAFFPSITLTGSAGSISGALNGLFDGGTHTWSFVPNITLPIFTGGANLANLRAAQAYQKKTIADYELAIQSAFQEVADALATEGTVSEELAAQQQLAAATAESLRLSEERYKNGADSYLNVLDSQRANFSAQQAVISAQLARTASLVTLYKVLGGGSQLEDVSPETTEAK